MNYKTSVFLLLALFMVPFLTACNNSNVSKAEAAEIALKHAGVTFDDVNGLHTEYDKEDGLGKYEVKFYYNGHEYEYDIDAGNGNLLYADMD